MVSGTQVFTAFNYMFDFVDLFFAVLILCLWIYGMMWLLILIFWIYYLVFAVLDFEDLLLSTVKTDGLPPIICPLGGGYGWILPPIHSENCLHWGQIRGQGRAEVRP